MRGSLLIAGAASLWGTWSLCFRSAERLAPDLTAPTEAFIVFAVMLCALAPFAVQRHITTRSLRAWLLLLGLGVSDALNCLCFFGAMQRTTVAVAVLTHYFTPVLVALLAPVLLGERWQSRVLLATAMSLSGLVLLLEPWSSAVGDWTGAGLGALSAVFYAGNVFLGKHLGNRFTPMELASLPKLASLLVLGAALPNDGLALDAAPLLILVGGGIVCGALPLVMFYRGLALVPASQASVLTLCEPLVAVLVGAVAWNEKPGAPAVLGALLVLGGAAVIAKSASADLGRPKNGAE